MLGVVDRPEVDRSTKMIEELPRQFALRHLFAALDARQVADIRVDGIGDRDQRLSPREAGFSECLALCHGGEFALSANLAQAPCLRRAH